LLTSPALNISDVCYIGNNEFPFAVAAFGMDRSIHFVRDIRSDSRIAALRFPGLEGVAYRILSAQGHAFLLTSEWLYSLRGLVEAFLSGQRIDGLTRVQGWKLQAVDANLAFQRWLLVVMPDHVRSIAIDELMSWDEKAPAAVYSGNGTIRDSRPDLMDYPWESPREYQLLSTVTV
jgi:hypothetical protein